MAAAGRSHVLRHREVELENYMFIESLREVKKRGVVEVPEFDQNFTLNLREFHRISLNFLDFLEFGLNLNDF